MDYEFVDIAHQRAALKERQGAYERDHFQNTINFELGQSLPDTDPVKPQMVEEARVNIARLESGLLTLHRLLAALPDSPPAPAGEAVEA